MRLVSLYLEEYIMSPDHMACTQTPFLSRNSQVLISSCPGHSCVDKLLQINHLSFMQHIFIEILIFVIEHVDLSVFSIN
jgi:hypothetical protein